MPRKLRSRPAAVGVAVVVALATTGLALGAKGRNDGRIVACYEKKGGELRVVKRRRKCRPGERRVAWRKRGPQGERGAPGAPGEPGQRGRRGRRGEPGLPGTKGETGDQGARGLTGLQGVQGDAGPQGTAGPEGPSGVADAFVAAGDAPSTAPDKEWTSLSVTPTGTGSVQFLVFTVVTPTVQCSSGICSVTYGLYLDDVRINAAGATVEAAAGSPITRSIFLTGMVTMTAGVVHTLSVESADTGSVVNPKVMALPQQITAIQLG